MENFKNQLSYEIRKTYSTSNPNLLNLSDLNSFIQFGYPEDVIAEYKNFTKFAFPIAYPFKNIRVKGSTLLNLGSGIGLDSIAAVREGAEKVIEVDISETFILEGIKHPNIMKIIGNIEEINFKKKSFDIILMNGSMNIILDKLSLISKSNYALKSRGLLIISDLFTEHKFDECIEDINAWCWCLGGCITIDKMIAIAEKEGFLLLSKEEYEQVEKFKRVRFLFKKC